MDTPITSCGTENSFDVSNLLKIIPTVLSKMKYEIDIPECVEKAEKIIRDMPSEALKAKQKGIEYTNPYMEIGKSFMESQGKDIFSMIKDLENFANRVPEDTSNLPEWLEEVEKFKKRSPEDKSNVPEWLQKIVDFDNKASR